MTRTASKLVLFGLDRSVALDICASVESHHWNIYAKYVKSSALDALAAGNVAAVIIGPYCPDAAAFVAEIRDRPEPANGTPVFVIGGTAPDALGAGGHLPLPFDRDAFLELLQRWAGPIDDHALRRLPLQPRYRLIRLLGMDNALTMLGRLRDALAEAVRDPDIAPAHRLAGLAGMLGYGELGALWSRVDRGDTSALPGAVAASRAAIEEIGRTVPAG